MIQFYETQMGRKFFSSDVPRIAKALESLVEQLNRLNDNLEKGAADRRELWAVNIEWDTDGEDDSPYDLPTEVKMPRDYDRDSEVADYLSDTYGYCVVSCGVEYR